MTGYAPEDMLISLTSKHKETHTLLIGGSGSGKTCTIQHFAAQDIDQSHSIVILDLRGDLVQSIVNLCASMGVDPARVKIIDLREKQRPFGFNPLTGAGEPYFRALNVLRVLQMLSESWGVQIAECINSSVMLLSECHLPLTDIERLFYDAPFLNSCLTHSKNQSVLSFWSRYKALSQDKKTALIWPVLNKFSLLFATDTLRKVLGHPEPIDLGSHLDKKGSILLVSLAVDELHSAAHVMGAFILAAISREIFGRVQESHRNPVRCYVDECQHFLDDDFETIVTEGRRFGISLILALQTTAQFSPKMKSLVLNNFGVKFAFRCGRSDSDVLCKDMTGDPHALDLNDLPPGEALMWVKGYAAEHIEINQPLDITPKMNWASRDFLDEVYESSPHFELPEPVAGFRDEMKSDEFDSISGVEVETLIIRTVPVKFRLRSIAPSKALAQACKSRGVPSFPVFELTQSVEARKFFSDRVNEANVSHGFGDSEPIDRTDSFYAYSRFFLSEDGLSGFSIDEYQIFDVFNHHLNPKRGVMQNLLGIAASEKGLAADVRDGALPHLFAPCGFKCQFRISNQSGSQIYAHMVHDPDNIASYNPENVPLVYSWTEAVCLLEKMKKENLAMESTGNEAKEVPKPMNHDEALEDWLDLN